MVPNGEHFKHTGRVIVFEKDETISDLTDRLYEFTQRLSRGDILTHNAIQSILGVDPHVNPWDNIIEKIRAKMQRERGIWLKPEIKVGYKLCTIKEQLEMPSIRLTRAARQARRGRKHVESLPLTECTLHDIKKRQFLIERTKAAEKAVKDEITAHHAILSTEKPTEERRPMWAIFPH